MIEGKALQLGALECHVVDAREEFAHEYVAAGDQGQRALRRRLPAVHGARAPADRQARGRARARERLRHDRARLHRQGQRPGAHRGDDRDARARAEGDRAGALVADGARGGDRLRARARHPDQGPGHRGRRPTRSTTTSGGAPRRAAGSRTSSTPPRTTSSSSSRRPERAPDERAADRAGLRARRARRARRRAPRARRADRTGRARSARATASASSTTSRTASSG